MMAIDFHSQLIALGTDKRASTLSWNMLARVAPDWVVGIVTAANDQAVHAEIWERHPAGDEILYLIEGRLLLTLLLEDKQEKSIDLLTGQVFIVPQGIWHRIHVIEPAQLLFVKPPVGTEHRFHADSESLYGDGKGL
ncbi:cupin domain-containing protein [Aquirhabdus parva]|nr:cupin domain-containing protein [Aquirhabdus parva]